MPLARGAWRCPVRPPAPSVAFAVVMVAVIGCALAAPHADAQAATPSSCRASAARVVVGGAVASEPTVAGGPGSPCPTEARRLAGAQPVGPLTASAPAAATRAGGGVIAASASVADAALSSPVPVRVGAVRSMQMRSCVNGRSVSSGTSSVDALTVAGIPVAIIGGQTIDQTVAGVRIRANVLEGDTRRALVLDVAGTEVVLGEATASGDACATASSQGTGTGTGTTRAVPDGSSQVCPDGSEYRVEDNVCVITVPAGAAGGGANGATARTIVVGRPYTGPSGGTLVALSVARALVQQGKLPASSCLSGPGPQYVVLGDGGADRITGTNGPDRILGLGGADQLAGGRGADCLDGGTGSDTLSGSDGADRLLGGTGNDHLNGGSGSDRLSGQAGRDTINTGYGADRAFGGDGNDALNAATAGPAARISGGRGRDTVRANRNERRRITGAERVFTLR